VERTAFSALSGTGEVAGWVAGEGLPAVLLHGGPGISYSYMDDAAAELIDSYRVVTFQQRGLPPSSEQGPFTIAQALLDIEAVLDHFGWERAYLVGHSWGGHLAFHAAVSLPHRLLGVLAVDPLGAVGDGAAASFGAEMESRMSEDNRRLAEELDARVRTRERTEADVIENFGLVWASYFADPAHAPPVPAVRWSLPAHVGLWAEMEEALPRLEQALPRVDVPLGVLVGAASPIPPQEAGLASAERIPRAWAVTVPGAGHFVWFERPGCLLQAMDRLTNRTP